MSRAVEGFLTGASRHYRPDSQICIELSPQGLRYFLRESELEGVAGFYDDYWRAAENVEEVMDNPGLSRDASTQHIVINNCHEESMELFLCWLPNHSFAELKTILDGVTNEDWVDTSQTMIKQLVQTFVFSLDKRISGLMDALFDLLLHVLNYRSPACLSADVVRTAFKHTVRFEAVRTLIVRDIIWSQTCEDGHAIDVNDYNEIEGFQQLYNNEMAKAISSANRLAILPKDWGHKLKWYEQSSYKLPECDF